MGISVVELFVRKLSKECSELTEIVLPSYLRRITCAVFLPELNLTNAIRVRARTTQIILFCAFYYEEIPMDVRLDVSYSAGHRCRWKQRTGKSTPLLHFMGPCGLVSDKLVLNNGCDSKLWLLNPLYFFFFCGWRQHAGYASGNTFLNRKSSKWPEIA